MYLGFREKHPRLLQEFVNRGIQGIHTVCFATNVICPDAKDYIFIVLFSRSTWFPK
jgi:hypothetical protein